LIVAGRTNREIAQELFVELSTVKWYVGQIYRKLGARMRRQAVLRARGARLFSKEEQSRSAADAKSEAVSISLMAPSYPYKGLRAFEVAGRRWSKNSWPGWRTAGNATLPPGNGRFLAVVGPSRSGI
jgi:hypothetical protein